MASHNSPRARETGQAPRFPDLATPPSWGDTCKTMLLWGQIIGKTRLALAPMMNHWWQVPLYVSARGLTTSPIPYSEGREFEVELDLVSHRLDLRSNTGLTESFALKGGSTLAEFYERYFQALRKLGVEVDIYPIAVEMPETIALDRDTAVRPYDRDWAHRFFLALVQADRLLKRFRASYQGKVSPVHFFWGSFDLAVSRFSGRKAPLHPGGAPHCPDRVMQEAYSHELSSAGFWPGGTGGVAEAAFYSYAYPEPEGYAEAAVLPEGAYYDSALREFILPYAAVRKSSDPERDVSSFLESTYAAAADLGRWDRTALERPSRVRLQGGEEASHGLRM